jgi:hypothetical protein
MDIEAITSATTVFRVGVDGEANERVRILGSGEMRFGTGSSAPDIRFTFGSSAPSASASDGSIYVRTGASAAFYQRVSGSWVQIS